LLKRVFAQDLDGSSFMGSRLRIEHSRDSRDSRRDRYSPPRGRFSWVETFFYVSTLICTETRILSCSTKLSVWSAAGYGCLCLKDVNLNGCVALYRLNNSVLCCGHLPRLIHLFSSAAVTLLAGGLAIVRLLRTSVLAQAGRISRISCARYRGKVMSQEANKLQMPFLANSIYSRDPISKMSINCRSPFWPIQSIVEPISNTSINDTVARFK